MKGTGPIATYEGFRDTNIDVSLKSKLGKISSDFGFGQVLKIMSFKGHSCDNVTLVVYEKKEVILKFVHDIEIFKLDVIFSKILPDNTMLLPYSKEGSIYILEYNGKNILVYDYIPHLRKISGDSNPEMILKFKKILFSLLKGVKKTQFEILNSIKMDNKISYDEVKLRYKNILSYKEEFLSKVFDNKKNIVELAFSIFEDNYYNLMAEIDNLDDFVFSINHEDWMGDNKGNIYIIDPHIKANLYLYYIASYICTYARLSSIPIVDVTNEFLAELQILDKVHIINVLELYFIISRIFKLNDSEFNNNFNQDYIMMNDIIEGFS